MHFFFINGMATKRKNVVYSPQQQYADYEKSIGAGDKDWEEQGQEMAKVLTLKNFFKIISICFCIVFVFTMFAQLFGFITVYQESSNKVNREIEDAEKSLESSTCLYYANKLHGEDKKKFEESAIRDKKGRENCERYHDYLSSSKISKVLIEVGNSYGMCKFGECSTVVKDVFFKVGVTLMGIGAAAAPYILSAYFSRVF